MSATAGAAAALWLLLLAASAAGAGEAPRLDPTQFLPDAGAPPLRRATGPAFEPLVPNGAARGDVAFDPADTRRFAPNFERLRKDWMRQPPAPPLVFREPFPRRRSVQDRRGEGVAIVLRAVAP